MKLDIGRGAIVAFQGRNFEITNDALGFDEVEARDIETGRFERLLISSLSEPIEELQSKPAPDLDTIDSAYMVEARRRAEVIRRIAALPRLRRVDVENAMAELAIGKTTLYRWLKMFRSDGRLTSLMPTRRPGGRGKSRLAPDVERTLQAVIEKHHLTGRQVSVQSTIKRVRQACIGAGLEAPHGNTVRARISSIPKPTLMRRRGHKKEADTTFNPAPDHYGEPTHPLAVVQIDHTRLDIILVDEEYRLPLQRPWFTLAYDAFSKMVLGFYISFDSPGSLGTGLCIARSILPKETWLAKLGVKHEWPCWGFPEKIQFDNAQEFKSETVVQGCAQYGIAIDYRPIAAPSTGGGVERAIGSLHDQRIHELPGAALNPKKRGEHDAEADAAMTLPEVETTLAEFITGVYHKEIHSEIHTTPLQRWTDAILGDGKRPGVGQFPRPTNENRLRLDFMPIEKRTVGKTGVQIDNIFYYSDVLRPFINDKNTYVFRRDPRDISVIHFWNADIQEYSVVPYRNSLHPPISVWELQAIQRRIKKEGRKHVDERELFETYERLIKHEEDAKAETKRVRRRHERKAALARESKDKRTTTPGRIRQQTDSEEKVVPLPTVPRRFDNIQPLEMEEEL